jgi:probable HAF family extracellular repeat protein
MNIKMMKYATVVFVLAASAFAQTWVEFSVSSNGLGTRTTAINASGQVAGWYNTVGSGPLTGFVRNTDGTIVKLSAPKHTYLTPTAINTAGEIAGDLVYYNHQYGFYDLSPAPFQEFGAAWAYTAPAAVNDAGYIAGTIGCLYKNCGSWGFLLSPTGTVTDITIPKAFDLGVAGMNNSNQIVGSCVNWKKITEGFLYGAGNATLLKVSGAAGTYAEAINDSGEVVGGWWDSSYVHGFVWTQAQGFTLFDFPHESNISWGASAINSAGVVVGSFGDAKGHSHGFIRDAAGHFTILNAPHASSTWAIGINASGQVTGFYVVGTETVAHAFIYTP